MKGCRAITDIEIELVKKELKNPRDYAIFILGLKCGFRVSELLSIKVSDVIQFNSIVSHLTVSRKNMKGKHSSRTTILHPEAKSAILELINAEHLESEHYLFQSRKGINQPIKRGQAWTILKTAFRMCQLQGKVATHSLRKSFAARVYEATNKDIVKTQHALGHKSLSSTSSYLDASSDEIDNAILSIK